MGNKTFEARYLQAYRKQNPEKQEQWRTTSEINHLRSLGYAVIEPKKQPEEMTLEELENKVDEIRRKKREYARAWRARNKDRIKGYNRRYRQKPRSVSPEKRREYQAKWRAKHREELRAYHRNYYALHPEQAKESREKWRAKNPHYEKLRWRRYKDALAKARKEQQDRIRRDIEAMKNQKGGEY